MPLPKPIADETQDDFIDRCMASDEMNEEFPDQDQRLAVCFQRWKDKEKKSAEPGEMSAFERRFFAEAEIRLVDENAESAAITGYAAVFNSWSEDLGFFKEKIAQGAFAKSVKDGDVRALINHDPNLIIGRTRNRTLRLWEDDKGLGFEVKLPDTSYAHDLRESIKRKDITQNSFGFQTVVDEWSTDGKRRTLHEVRLFDVSPVTFPAYKQTSVKLRLRELGIDYDTLGLALIRSTRGIVLNSDIDLIRSTIQILGAYVPNPAEPPAAAVSDGPGHSAPEVEPELVSTLIRARLAEHMLRQNLRRRVSA